MTILSWHNKEDAVNATKRTAYRLLREVPQYSYSGSLKNHSEQAAMQMAAKNAHPTAENLIIQGDNLQALKSLLPFYAGQVKCIFIDPPYNTKSAFKHYDDNLEHSLWLSLMYPRLELLRELLSEDGSIWITLDDNESHYFKVMADEIFGRKNFVANVVWQKKHTRANDATNFSDNHDHILCYAKNKEKWARNLLERTDESNSSYSNPDNDPRGVWQTSPLHAKSGSENNKNFSYTFKNGVVWQPPVGTFPRFSEETLKRLDDDNRIWFGKNGTNVPRQKKFLSEIQNGLVPVTIWLHEEVGHNQDAKNEVKLFNADEVFDTPKPERLIQRILQIATNENDLVLDSFLGSGTTVAVAHKMNRRYIGIEMGEHAKTHIVPRLKAVIDGEQGGISVSKEFFALENDDLQELDLEIDDIKKFEKILTILCKETELIDKTTLNNLKKAVKTKKVKSESVWQGGGSFCFCELGETVFDEQGQINSAVRFADLAHHLWYMENRIPFAVPNEYSPLLGVYQEKAIYLLYNGILGDKRPNGGNVLTQKIFTTLPKIDEMVAKKINIIVYGEACRLSEQQLAEKNMVFKQIPYDVSVR
ncbi:MAG: site-specific DNA-methyltransferase [Neisseriaceae bacterium]|nr:site-specific DNA-methyltransferase [Neisseriaceae bacterium]